MQDLAPRRCKSSVDELLHGVSSRKAWKHAESLSGSALERVVIDGERYVLKHMHVDDDWIQRATGDLRCRAALLWSSGLYDELPECIDHAIVDVADGLGRNGWGAAVLLRDLSECFVPVEHGAIPLDQHLRFLEHMAELHARFWGFTDTVGLLPSDMRYRALTPSMASLEAARSGDDPVPKMVPDGWRRMALEAPGAADVVLPLLDDPLPLVRELDATPQTLIHGDWKAGNLGSHPDGRTILVDWAWPGIGSPAVDLAWYLAVNCDLLPHSKEASIDAYHDALVRLGIATGGWWTTALELALLGALVQLGWSKSGAELAWWADRVPRAAGYL